MKKRILIIILITMLFLISSCREKEEIPVFSPDYSCEEEPSPGIINVKFKEDYTFIEQETIIDLKSRYPELKNTEEMERIFTNPKNTELSKKIGLDRWVRITVSKIQNVEEEAEKWKALPEVEKVELVYPTCLLLVPSESGTTQFVSQWYINNTGENFPNITFDADIDAIEAWDFETGSLTVSNPDTAIYWKHEDLTDNIWRNLGEDFDGDGDVLEWNITLGEYVFDPDDENGVDDDGNGYVDDFIGWDFKDNDNDPSPPYGDDNEAHGTSTAGVMLASTNNSIGVAGVCWNCKDIALRGGEVYPTNLASIQYAVDNGAKIISMSWLLLGSGESLVLDTLDYAYSSGVLLLTGSGNNGNSRQLNKMCKTEKILCVGGTTAWDTIWIDSNFGSPVDVSAPAAVIQVITPPEFNPYGSQSGTSLSTPMVAGIAALMLTKNPNLSQEEVKSILQSSTDPIVSPSYYVGTGRVNAQKALNLTNTSLQFGGHFPVSIIDGNKTQVMEENITLIGTANGVDFSKYEIYAGQGVYPQNWVWLSEGYSSKQEEIISVISLYSIPEGTGQIKLVVTDTNNQVAYDTFPYQNGVGDCGNGICDLGEDCSLCEADCGICHPCFYLDQSSCLSDQTCEWCPDCQNTKVNQFTRDACVEQGTCQYECVTNECNSECNEGKIINTSFCGIIDPDIAYYQNLSCSSDCLLIVEDEIQTDCSINWSGCDNGICQNCRDYDSDTLGCASLQGSGICEWCPNCNNLQSNLYGGNVCSDMGACSYGCILGSCGAECGLDTDCILGQVCSMDCSCVEGFNTILQQGWNFVSIPNSLTDSNPDQFNSETVLAYEGGWIMNHKGFNQISSLETGKGYVVYSNLNQTITFEGVVDDQYTYPITPGSWTLVGVTSADTIANIYNPSYTVFEWNGNNFLDVTPQTLTIGKSYWVYPGQPQTSPPTLPINS